MRIVDYQSAQLFLESENVLRHVGDRRLIFENIHLLADDGLGRWVCCCPFSRLLGSKKAFLQF